MTSNALDGHGHGASAVTDVLMLRNLKSGASPARVLRMNYAFRLNGREASDERGGSPLPSPLAPAFLRIRARRA